MATVPIAFEFLDADAGERAHFCDLAAVRSLPHSIAAPPNRNRRVLRIEHGGRSYFAKEFGPSSWNNRIRFATSRPLARNDAEREAMMTLALRANGIAAPRPVLRATSARGSFYLCAQLGGAPLALLIMHGKTNRSLQNATAEFCGKLLAAGFWLPDLCADHVFVSTTEKNVSFGVLDLHNGTLASPGSPPRWLLRRVLRHFARSVEQLPITGYAALRFAARLLRAAGYKKHRRALLASLPLFDTAARYEIPLRSQRYAKRNPARTARELSLLKKVWPGKPGERVLDVPCGAGRLQAFLLALGHQIVWADGALSMVRQACADTTAAPPSVQTSALQLGFADRSFDGVLQFRFLHHLPRHKAKTAVAEACRVAQRFVVVSVFHPCSLHHLQRRLRELLLGRAATRHATTLRQLQRWFSEHGFELHTHRADLPFLKDLWVASFVRRSS